MKEFAADLELAFLGGMAKLHNEKEIPRSIVTFTERFDLSSTPEKVFKPAIIVAKMYFKWEVISKIGGFDVRQGLESESCAIAEDVNYLHMAYRKGFKIV